MHPHVQKDESPKQKGRLTGKRPQLVARSPDVTILIATRAHELYAERGYRHGYALDDWLEAEREILSRVPPM